MVVAGRRSRRRAEQRAIDFVFSLPTVSLLTLARSSSGEDSPPRKRARGSPASSCGTPWEVVKAREELAALEAAAAARLRAKIDRHERKKHEKKHRR